MNMNRRTSISLIENAVREGWIKQLAFYHQMKFRFNNSCIYDYKSRMSEIASQFDISERTFYRYLEILRSKGLICDHANNLKLKSIREFTNRKKATLIITEGLSLFDITCLLYAKLIERKARQMAFMESVRRSGRGDRLNVRLCEIPFRPSLSYRTIAKLLNVSEYKANLVLKNLNQLKIIESKKRKFRLITEDFTNLKSIEDMPGYRFNIGSKLFENFGQKHDFLQFPVYLKRYSHKQLKRFNNSI